jgi:hypothetical protein
VRVIRRREPVEDLLRYEQLSAEAQR